jgi:hypothetical protein
MLRPGHDNRRQLQSAVTRRRGGEAYRCLSSAGVTQDDRHSITWGVRVGELHLGDTDMGAVQETSVVDMLGSPTQQKLLAASQLLWWYS